MSEVAPDAPFEMAPPTEEETRGREWPELTFAFSEQNVFGKVLPTNTIARLRSVATSIHDVVPLATGGRSGQEVVSDLERMRGYLIDRVHYKRQSMQRRLLCPPEDVCADVWLEELSPARHPLVQAWEQIYEQNEKRRASSVAQPGLGIRKLSKQELDTLAVDLVLSLQGPAVQARYRELGNDWRGQKSPS